jgi:imidazolonepropionase-like amidohydrolase
MSRCALAVLVALVAAGTVEAKTVIHAGTLIDAVQAEPRDRVSIIVDGDRIEAVVDGFATVGPADNLIDLSNHTLMPGLMDMHTHLAGQMSKDSYNERFRLNPTDYAIRATAYAKRTLMAGFTTVRDLGDDGVVVVSLRNAINAGVVPGPRIYTAGKSLATTGGHADPTNGWKADLKGDPGPKQGVINGAEEAREAVRHRYKDGADLIKLTATGGVLSLAKSGENPQFTQEELEAVVATAADYGFTVAVHAHGSEGMKRAVEAGVTSIEHGTFMTDEIMQLMKKRGTYYVPTILAGVFVGEKAAEEDYFPAIVRPKAAKIGPAIHDTFARAVRAGVKIAFGTDSGVSPHGGNAREFELMVAGGMQPLHAIQSATIVAAQLLRIDDELGSVEPGKRADVVAVLGNPLEEIGLLRSIDFVMKDGKVYKRTEAASLAGRE